MVAATHKGEVSFEADVTCSDVVDLVDAAVDMGARTVASDGALTIDGTDRVIILLGSAAGAKAATITAPTANASGGPLLSVVLKAWSGGSYTVACTNAGVSGTLTLDAALESATLAWVNGVLNVITLTGATFA